jgi:hypothetical protein
MESRQPYFSNLTDSICRIHSVLLGRRYSAKPWFLHQPAAMPIKSLKRVFYQSGCPIRRHGGFTPLELLVVLVNQGLLVGYAAPKYFSGSANSRETILKEGFAVIRDAIEKYYGDGDRGRYPNASTNWSARATCAR